MTDTSFYTFVRGKFPLRRREGSADHSATGPGRAILTFVGPLPGSTFWGKVTSTFIATVPIRWLLGFTYLAAALPNESNRNSMPASRGSPSLLPRSHQLTRRSDDNTGRSAGTIPTDARCEEPASSRSSPIGSTGSWPEPSATTISWNQCPMTSTISHDTLQKDNQDAMNLALANTHTIWAAFG